MTPLPLEMLFIRQIGGIAGAGQAAPDALRARQLELLNETLAWARSQSPFWRMQLTGAPNKLDSLDDLSRLPLLTPEDLREHGQAMCCLPQGAFARVTTILSSATTGPSKRLYFTQDDLEATVAFFAAGMAHIVTSGEAVLLLMPGDRPGTVGDLLSQGLARIGSACHAVGFLRDVAAVRDWVRRQAATCLVGLPWQVLALARTGGPIPGLRSVLLSADRAPRWLVKEVAVRLGCEVFLHWGMTETGLGGAVDCPAHAGLHIRALDLYLEIINPLSGAPLPVGEAGEVVLTTLARRGMPLLRYRTGDRGRLLSGPCGCGSLLPRLENPEGRLAAPLVLSSGGKVDVHQLDDVLLQTPGLVACALELHRHPGKDVLQVQACGGHVEDVAARLQTIPGGRALELEWQPQSLEALLATTPPKRTVRTVIHEEFNHAVV